MDRIKHIYSMKVSNRAWQDVKNSRNVFMLIAGDTATATKKNNKQTNQKKKKKNIYIYIYIYIYI